MHSALFWTTYNMLGPETSAAARIFRGMIDESVTKNNVNRFTDAVLLLALCMFYISDYSQVWCDIIKRLVNIGANYIT